VQKPRGGGQRASMYTQDRVTRQNTVPRYYAITPFSVIQGHRGLYQSDARIRLPISD